MDLPDFFQKKHGSIYETPIYIYMYINMVRHILHGSIMFDISYIILIIFIYHGHLMIYQENHPTIGETPRRDRAVNVSVSHGAPVDMSTVLVSRAGRRVNSRWERWMGKWRV